MPTYEYECLKCKERFELFQSITAKPVKACPKCRGRVRRLISAGSGIIFKGSGFYATDYRKGKKPDGASCPLGQKGAACQSCPGQVK
ncbi:MAG: zinc ribbon domain-containing protein [Candidatus Omnitrophota bacterium]|nr:MAG: zinc ribbon domain-containing protein [Candidatus Omnitrophota bacterium]